MNRTSWLAVLGLVLLAAGAFTLTRWPSSATAFDAGELPKLDLNTASEDQLAQVPGIGPKLAHALVEGRAARSGFQSWDEVAGVRGVGPAKLRLLQDAAQIR